MSFRIGIRSEENEKLSALLMDLITSAAFFQRKEINIQQEEETLAFTFEGYCPNEYLDYLNWKYDLSLEYLDKTA